MRNVVLGIQHISQDHLVCDAIQRVLRFKAEARREAAQHPSPHAGARAPGRQHRRLGHPKRHMQV